MKLAPALALTMATLACAGPRPAPTADGPAGLDASAAREVLVRFAGALEGGRFAEAYALLSPRWRALSSPARLATDWGGAAAAAGEAAARVRTRGGDAPVTLEGGRARVSLGEGRAALLVAEGNRWRVDALE